MGGSGAVLLVWGVGVECCHSDQGSSPFSPSLPRREEWEERQYTLPQPPR